MGYYKEMPDDERAPRKRPPLKIYECDFKIPVRPSSAVFTHEELEIAMEKASAEAGERLKNSIVDRSVRNHQHTSSRPYINL